MANPAVSFEVVEVDEPALSSPRAYRTGAYYEKLASIKRVEGPSELSVDAFAAKVQQLYQPNSNKRVYLRAADNWRCPVYLDPAGTCKVIEQGRPDEDVKWDMRP